MAFRNAARVVVARVFRLMSRTGKLLMELSETEITTGIPATPKLFAQMRMSHESGDYSHLAWSYDDAFANEIRLSSPANDDDVDPDEYSELIMSDTGTSIAANGIGNVAFLLLTRGGGSFGSQAQLSGDEVIVSGDTTFLRATDTRLRSPDTNTYLLNRRESQGTITGNAAAGWSFSGQVSYRIGPFGVLRFVITRTGANTGPHLTGIQVATVTSSAFTNGAGPTFALPMQRADDAANAKMRYDPNTGAVVMSTAGVFQTGDVFVASGIVPID